MCVCVCVWPGGGSKRSVWPLLLSPDSLFYCPAVIAPSVVKANQSGALLHPLRPPPPPPPPPPHARLHRLLGSPHCKKCAPRPPWLRCTVRRLQAALDELRWSSGCLCTRHVAARQEQKAAAAWKCKRQTCRTKQHSPGSLSALMGMCGRLVVKVCAAVPPARRLLSLLPPDEKGRSLEEKFRFEWAGRRVWGFVLQVDIFCSAPSPLLPLLPPLSLLGIKRRWTAAATVQSSAAERIFALVSFLFLTKPLTHSHTHWLLLWPETGVFISSRRVFTFLFLQLSVFLLDPFGFYPLLHLPWTSGAFCPGRSVPTWRVCYCRVSCCSSQRRRWVALTAHSQQSTLFIHFFIIQQRWFVFCWFLGARRFGDVRFYAQRAQPFSRFYFISAGPNFVRI